MSTADRYRRLAEGFDSTVKAVSPSDWDNPSPRVGWSTRDVLSHVIDSEADIVTNVGLSMTRSIDVTDDPVAAWREVREGIQAILDNPDEAALEYESLGSSTTIAGTIDRFLCFDLIIHRWDIARAAGQDITIDIDDVADANVFLDSMGQMFYDYGAGAPAIAVNDDASPQAKLLGRAGRDAQWSPGYERISLGIRTGQLLAAAHDAFADDLRESVFKRRLGVEHLGHAHCGSVIG